VNKKGAAPTPLLLTNFTPKNEKNYRRHLRTGQDSNLQVFRMMSKTPRKAKTPCVFQFRHPFVVATQQRAGNKEKPALLHRITQNN
jgi:hypothetical protein